MYIREFRKKKGLTQAELAELLEIHENTLRHWENEKFEPRSNDLIKICKVLDCTEAELLNGPIKQEFEVKIIMGVKNLPNVAGLAIDSNTFFYGIEDEEPQIHLAGKVRIETQEERDKALAEIIKKFKAACWMFDHKDEAGKDFASFASIQPA